MDSDTKDIKMEPNGKAVEIAVIHERLTNLRNDFEEQKESEKAYGVKTDCNVKDLYDKHRDLMTTINNGFMNIGDKIAKSFEKHIKEEDEKFKVITDDLKKVSGQVIKISTTIALVGSGLAIAAKYIWK